METIQNQAGQIQALSHVLMIALVSISEQRPAFRDDFLDLIIQFRNQLEDHPVDRYTMDYFDELVRFLEDPYKLSGQR